MAACGEDPSFFCERVLDWTGSENAAETLEWVIGKPLRIGLILVGAVIVRRFAARAISRAVERVAGGGGSESPTSVGRAVDRLTADASLRARQRARTLGAVLRNLASGVIYVMAGLMVLGELRVNLAPLIAGAGIAGIAIGFGAQSIVKDFLAGIFILVEDQYGVGDVIDLGEAFGTVEEVTLRTTRLRNPSGVVWVVPNGEITRVGNTSQLWSMAVLDVEVAYDTDVALAKQVILDTLVDAWRSGASELPIIEEPRVLGVESLSDSSIVIRASVKTAPGEQFQTARVLREQLKVAFDDAGVEIPFPQRTVWLRTAEPALDDAR